MTGPEGPAPHHPAAEVPPSDALLCRIATAEQWAAAQTAGALPLDPDGFVHLSAPSQVAGTLYRFYDGATDLVVLSVRLDHDAAAALRWEQGEPRVRFPHLYRPLPIAAVVAVDPVPPLDDHLAVAHLVATLLERAGVAGTD